MNRTADTNALFRIPGLFRRWELGQLLEPGRSYHLEDAGETSEGTELLAVYRGNRQQQDGKVAPT